MKAVYVLLRIVRVLFGLAGIAIALVGASAIMNAEKLGGLEPGVNRLFIAFMCLMIFGLLRWLINKLHASNNGVPHPALGKEWSL